MAVKFLGCSVVNYNGSLGWGDTASSVTVNIAEDKSDGDLFQTPSVGEPTVFAHQQFTFGGLIQSWKFKENSSSIDYEIVIVDPRDLLSGVSVILDGYNGSTNGLANLLNVYGYYENTTFGSSRRTEAGMPWQLVRDGIVALTQGAAPTYGDAIAVGPHTFEINLSELPALPEYYRISSSQLTIMDFVKEICDAANHDYFFSMNIDKSLNKFITLTTINRNFEPVFGAITSFISSTPGAVAKDTGFEFRQEVTGKFLVGGPQLGMFYQTTNLDTNDYWNNNIWPFWGYSNDGRLLLGEGVDDNHTVTLDASWLEGWPSNEYPTDVEEIRCAKEGIDEWKKFLVFNSKEFRNDGTNNPHFNKANTLDILGATSVNTIVDGLTNLDGIKNVINKLNVGTRAEKAKIISSNTNLIKEQAINQVYQFVQGFANEYYGRKWMVRTPQINVTRDEETNVILYSAEPVDAGFLDESDWPEAVANNLIPLDINKFTEEDGRIKAFVRFDNFSTLDFSEINENDIGIGPDGNSVFVRCDIDPILAFQDGTTLAGPRAIITLPGAVKYKITNANDLYEGAVSIVRKALYEKGTSLTNPTTQSLYTDAEIRPILENLRNSPGGDILNYGKQPRAVAPNTATIPFRSNIATYGPWSAVGSNGKMEFESDESLVPWNYGGFGVMNLAANARVVSSLSNYQQSETGTVEYPGTPKLNMGDALDTSGPYITDINVSVGDNVVTTRYQMSTWTPEPYKLAKTFADSVTRLSKTAQRLRRGQREVRGNNIRTVNVRAGKNFIRSLGNRRGTTHNLMWGMPISTSGETGSGANVVFGPDYDSNSQIAGREYNKQAGQSLDALFRPFSTNPNNSGLPVLNPASDAINPYVGSDFGFVVHGQTLPDSYTPVESGFNEADQRGIGFRLPMVGVGYGYNTDGKPVPNLDQVDEESDSFIPNYKLRHDLWKAGPIDFVWNADEKKWQVGSSCPKLNEIWHMSMFGGATSGSFSMAIDGETVNTIDLNITATGLAKQLEDEISFFNTGDIIGQGGPFPNTTINITFSGGWSNQPVTPPTFGISQLYGQAAIHFSRYQRGSAG